VPSTPQELIYQEALRGVQQQQAVLNELRSRTGILLAVAALASSFLGGIALEGDNVSIWSVLAIASLVGAGVASIRVLWPTAHAPGVRPSKIDFIPDWLAKRRPDDPEAGWIFTLSAEALEEDFGGASEGDDTAEAHLKVARALEHHWDRNQPALEVLFTWFQIAAILLLAEVAFWLIDLAT
jgi:hypothetical protein